MAGNMCHQTSDDVGMVIFNFVKNLPCFHSDTFVQQRDQCLLHIGHTNKIQAVAVDEWRLHLPLETVETDCSLL